MRAWAIMLGGLTVWALHFLVLYGIASALPGRPEARWLALAATLPAIAADLTILWKTSAGRRLSDPFDDWVARLGALGAALSLIAVIWQTVPALAL